MAINVASIDPSLRNFGVASLSLDLDTMKFTIRGLSLLKTDSRKGKTVRQNSDDLRRCQEIVDAYHAIVANDMVCFAEIPSGGQSARACLSFGMSIGMLASCPIPIIQVQPAETKLHTVGTKTASKQEMIEWAVETYPSAPWLRHGGRIILDNEHLADAIAVAHAGVKTDQFKQLMAIWRQTESRQAENLKVSLVS